MVIFTAGNVLSARLGGLAIDAGWGWTGTAPVAAALAAGGLLIWSVAWRRGRAMTAGHEVTPGTRATVPCSAP